MIQKKSILARNRVLSMIMAIGMIIALLVPMIAAMAEETTAAPAPATEAITATGSKPVLTMATSADFAPYEYKEGEGFAGIDIEIAQAIADKLGMELQIVDIAFDSVIAGVVTGKYDMGVSGLTMTPERAQTVNFTDPYANAVQTVIVKEDSDITSADDFYNLDAEGNPVSVKDGLMIGVQTSTTGDLYISDTVENGGVGEDHRIQYKTGADAVQALSTGKVQAVVIDNEPAKNFVKLYKGLKLLDTPYVEEEYAIAINKNNTELLQRVNVAISQLKADGTIAEITNKYINSGDDSVDTSTLAGQFRLNFINGDRWKWIVQGLGRTLLITLFAVLVGILIGIIIAAIRSSYDKNYEELEKKGGLTFGLMKVLNFLSNLYLTVIRGTPVVVQLLIMYFIIFASSKNGTLVAILTFGINSGAYVAEIFRSGIMAIDNGQFEAGRAVGFNYFQTMRYIILPQMIKVVLPTVLNEFISLLKETSIVGYVGIMDLTKAGDNIRGRTLSAFMPLIAVALIYLCLVIVLTQVMKALERRMRKNER